MKSLSYSVVGSGQLLGTELTSSIRMALARQCRDCSADSCRRASSMPAAPSGESRLRSVSLVRLLKLLTWSAKLLPAPAPHASVACET